MAGATVQRIMRTLRLANEAEFVGNAWDGLTIGLAAGFTARHLADDTGVAVIAFITGVLAVVRLFWRRESGGSADW